MERCLGEVYSEPCPILLARRVSLLSVVRPAFAVIAVVVRFSLSGEMKFVAAAGVRAGCVRRRHLPPSAHR